MVDPVFTTSRRAMIGALALGTLATTAPVVAATTARTTAPTGVSPALAEAIAAYHLAVTAAGKWFDTEYSPAWEACKAELDAIPHLTTEQGFETHAGFRTTYLSTDKPADVVLAKMFGNLPAHMRHNDSQDKACEELLAKVQWREAEKQRIQGLYNMDALDAEQDRQNDITYQAMRAVETFPVATMQDLIVRMEFALETDERRESADVLTDLRRIASGLA